MALDRPDRDEQPVRDLGVGQVVAHQSQHLGLALGDAGDFQHLGFGHGTDQDPWSIRGQSVAGTDASGTPRNDSDRMDEPEEDAIRPIIADTIAARHPARQCTTPSTHPPQHHPHDTEEMHDMTTTDTPMRNGVDTATLFATLDAVKANPDIAKFQFRATNRWVSGTHNRSTIHGFYGAGQELTHRHASTFDADHPEVLVGADHAPTPAEHLLHALAACLTSGLANIAAARGVNLTSVESTVEGDIDLLGILGLSDQVRNGYQQIRVSFHLEGDDPEKLRGVVEQSRLRSAVYDVITNGVPVSIEVTV